MGRRTRAHRSFLVPAILAMALSVNACGDAPLGSVGQRSSEWINEPEVSTTTTVPVTIPTVVSTTELAWSNDEIVNPNLDDPAAAVATVFARREGDRFIQASRAEIAVALPGVQFPLTAPFGAEWVSSQLVIDSSGEVADDPSAAFGIWSAEPYTRSRSVAQMAVLRVALDPEAVAELAEGAESPSCARFADRNTDSCDVIEIGGKPAWRLSAAGGTTLIWFDDTYRYELFGRDYIPEDTLMGMASATVPLAELEPEPS